MHKWEDKYFTCSHCPIDWGGIDCVSDEHGDDNGLYALWWANIVENNWQEAGKLALQIAELPERGEPHSERII